MALSAQIKDSGAAVPTSQSADYESSPPAAFFIAADLVRSDLTR
jgi:hypothetical protein